jgi:hypothetical protein
MLSSMVSANRTVTVTARTLTVGGAIGGEAVGFGKSGAGTLVLDGAGTTLGISGENRAL